MAASKPARERVRALVFKAIGFKTDCLGRVTAIEDLLKLKKILMQRKSGNCANVAVGTMAV